MSDMESKLAGVLAEHLLHDDRTTGLVCTCDEWRLTYREVNYPEAQHRAHVAAMQAAALARRDARVKAEAWDEGYAQAEKDFVHSDYCGLRCQCDPTLTAQAGNPYTEGDQ